MTRSPAELTAESARLEDRLDRWNLFGANGDAIRELEAMIYEARIDLEIASHPENYEPPVSSDQIAA